MKMKQDNRGSVRLGVCLAMLVVLPVALAVSYPSWWTARQVTDASSTVTNDYAAATSGQLKWFASNACDELEACLPGGAGTNVEAVIALFSSTNNYLAANAGQLKYVAKPFFDRLIAEGYTNAYPWTSTSTDDMDYAAITLGQLKYVFNFELATDTDADGLADWKEINLYHSSPTNANTDGDAYSDYQEVTVFNTDPSNPDTSKPNVSITYPTNNLTWVWLP